MLQPRPQHAFQRGMDLGQQAVQPVRDPGGLAGQVVVEVPAPASNVPIPTTLACSPLARGRSCPGVLR